MRRHLYRRMLLPFVLILSLLLGAAPGAGADSEAQTGTHPVIAVTFAPAYGATERNFVEGVVFREDGGDFNPADYRISLYLQVEPGGQYYVKPYAESGSYHSYVAIDEDGSFSVKCVSGGDDKIAKTLVVMLIPGDYIPGNSYNSFYETRNVALDTVTITRGTDGVNTIDPLRKPPYLSSGLSVSSNTIPMDVGFHTDGSEPGSALSEDLIRQHLSTIAPYCDTVRFYSASDEVSPAYGIARSMGFTVFGCAYLSGDTTADRRELDALIAHCNNGECSVAIVGNEMLLSGEMSAEQLIEAIRYVRERIQDDSIPVTTSDSFHILAQNASVCRYCDILMANCYPFWGKASIEEAEANFTESIATLSDVSRGKEIVISETGWPTQGLSWGNADPGEEEAARYYAMVRAWSLRTGVNVLYFSSVDEPWKVREEREVGAHWGFFNTDFTLKDCYAGLNPFGAGGVYGENIAWRAAGGVLTLSLAEGAEDGAMAAPEGDGSWEDYPWAVCAESLTRIVIEEGVSSVAPLAFGADAARAPYSGVTALSLAESVTSLGAGAFGGCTGLSAVIPATVTEIGEDAFADGADVRFAFPETAFALPTGLTAIQDEAFAGVNADCVWLPDGCESIGDRAFADCETLARIRIPAGTQRLGADVFAGCGRVYIYGEADSAAAAYCADPANANCRFLPLAQP